MTFKNIIKDYEKFKSLKTNNALFRYVEKQDPNFRKYLEGIGFVQKDKDSMVFEKIPGVKTEEGREAAGEIDLFKTEEDENPYIGNGEVLEVVLSKFNDILASLN